MMTRRAYRRLSSWLGPETSATDAGPSRLARGSSSWTVSPAVNSPRLRRDTNDSRSPSALGKEVARHLADFGLTGDDLLFSDPRTGTTPTITVWRRVWNKSRRSAEVECTFHDLRHHAGTLTASAGASVHESTARLGHASPSRCARYQHAAERRDVESRHRSIVNGEPRIRVQPASNTLFPIGQMACRRSGFTWTCGSTISSPRTKR